MTAGTMGAKARRVGDTSIRVDPDAKALLDRVRQEMGQQNLTYAEFLGNLARHALGDRSKEFPDPGTFDVDISAEMQPVLDRLDRLEGQLGGLGGLRLMADPKTGVIFDVMAAPRGNGTHDNESRGVDGDPIQMPKEGKRWAEERSGWGTPEPAGWWMQTPSEVYLTERDNTLPEWVEDLFEVEARMKKKATKKIE